MENYYLFVATFEDGTQIEQDRGDISALDSTKSQFYDVLEKSKESKLVSFVLIGEKIIGVDLTDGHFEIDGFPFWQHRVDAHEQDFTGFRIIYLRNNRVELNVTVHPETGEALEEPTTVHWLGYTLGWQITHEGKNIQRIIKI